MRKAWRRSWRFLKLSLWSLLSPPVQTAMATMVEMWVQFHNIVESSILTKRNDYFIWMWKDHLIFWFDWQSQNVFFLEDYLMLIGQAWRSNASRGGRLPNWWGRSEKKKKEEKKKKKIKEKPSFSPMHNHLKHQTHPQPIVWKGWQGNWWQRCRRGGRGGGGEAITGRRGASRRPHLWRVEAGLQVHHHHHHWSFESSSFSSS